MSSHSFGHSFGISVFGESHGKVVGGVIHGCPAGVDIDETWIQLQMDRRRPGTSAFASPRKEHDAVEWLSGIENGRSNGFPIAFIIRNTGHKPDDYKSLAGVFRPSHADYTHFVKYGLHPPAGTGTATARLLAPLVAGGSVARLLLRRFDISITAWVDSIGGIGMPENTYDRPDNALIENSKVRCPDKATSKKIVNLLSRLQKNGDTAGGTIRCVVSGCPAGFGEPLFEKLQAQLAHAMFCIPSVKGFEYGSGFAGTGMKGSEHNDPFILKAGVVATETNHSGGIQGGISNGMDICFRIAFKPVSAIHTKQQTLNVNKENVTVKIKGRHDVCVVPRAVPVVEAMAALVIADLITGKETTC